MVLAQLVPSLVVTAAPDGRAGVRDLVRRTFRWCVHLGWYAVAFLALPVAALLSSTVAFGSTAGLAALITDPDVLAAHLAFILPLVNLWEETAAVGVSVPDSSRREACRRGGAHRAGVQPLPLPPPAPGGIARR